MKNIKDNIIITICAIFTITFYSFIFYSMYRIDHLKVIDTKRYKVEATIIDTYHRSTKTEYIYIKGARFQKDISARSVITLKINGKIKDKRSLHMNILNIKIELEKL